MTGPVQGTRRGITSTASLPARLIEEPGHPAVLVNLEPDAEPIGWARTHRGAVDDCLRRRGAVVLRGFGSENVEPAEMISALIGPPVPYRERSSPRTDLGGNTYTATDHPADQSIQLHNENSYCSSFPAVLAFLCRAAPTTGGATPVADSRRVLARLDPDVVAEFVRRRIKYSRTYTAGLGLPWQEVFGTSDRDEVNRYCSSQGITTQWDRQALHTETIRPAVARHPVTGERSWFNHALFFHPSSLDSAFRSALIDQVGADDLPARTSYGDGAEFEPDVVRHLREAYAAECVREPWQVGDVLVVDNLLSSHGRDPFAGHRKIVVGMAGSRDWNEVAV